MTSLDMQALEKKLLEYKDTITDKQWNDADFLLAEVKRLEEEDTGFAFRLMQRVRTLSPTEENINRLNNIRAKAIIENSPSDNAGRGASKLSPRENVKKLVQFTSKPFSKENVNKALYPFTLFVVIPFILFSFYQVILASPRYESQAQMIVKEPNSTTTLDPAMAFMSGFGISSGASDTELVRSYIYSSDMLDYLEEQLKFSEHFSDATYDFYSRLSASASSEDKLKFFQNKVAIEIDEKSGVISLRTQAFEPEFSRMLSQTILDRAEWYINEVGRNLAKKQLEFVQKEHELVQERLREAKSVLLDFQRKYNLLDPEAEGLALQQISYKLEAEIAAKNAELRALSASMSKNAPLVMQARAELDSLQQQLEIERERLANNQRESGDGEATGVGQIMAKYSDYKINLELALQGYTSSLVSLEKSRIEAYRQIKYLVVVETPTLPEDAKYPKVFYNLALFLTLLLMLFGISKIVIATVNELR